MARGRAASIGRLTSVKILVSVREIGSVHATDVAGPVDLDEWCGNDADVRHDDLGDPVEEAPIVEHTILM